MVDFPISNIINVVIQTTQQGLGIPNINTAALFSSEAVPGTWTESQIYAKYTNASEVAVDFGTNSEAYRIAVAFFSQNPNVLVTNGYLVIATRYTRGEDPQLQSVPAAIVALGIKIFYFGILVDEALSANDLATLAAAVQALDKLLFYCSDDITYLDDGQPFDTIVAAGETHTRCLYYGNDDVSAWVFAASYAGRALTTDFSGSRTAGTMELKQLAGVTPDGTLDETTLGKAKDVGVDVYLSFGGLPSVVSTGTNKYYDQIYGEFWLKFALQVAGFNHLRQTNTKIPQTEEGMAGLRGAYMRVCGQAVVNGFGAPGAWNSPTVFGDPVSLRDNVAKFGYYVYSQPVADQAQSDREERKAPLCQIALKAAGAIHESNVIVNINL